MSTTEPLDDPVETLAEPWDDLETAPLRAQGPHVSTAIVPKGSIAGRSLAAVVAIMTFLAALTAGAVMMVISAANDWRSDVGREVTIQIRPVTGRDLDADVRKAVEIVAPPPALPTCAPTAKKSPRGWCSPGSAMASTSTTCRSRA